MDINEIYIKFVGQMSLCSMNQRLSLKMIESQKENIVNNVLYKDILKNEQYDEPLYMDNMYFFAWKDSSPIKYGMIDTTLNILWQNIFHYHNKPYQWNLAIAFEIYEKYLKEIISIMIQKGYISNSRFSSASKILSKLRNCLPKYRELESHTIKELDKTIVLKLLQEFDVQCEDIKRILNEKYDKRFSININNKFYLSLIEQMRHHIIHSNGIVVDKHEFIKNVLESIGLYNNGNFDKEYTNILMTYFTMQSNPNEIMLLEVPVINSPITAEVTDVLDDLFQVLLNSAYYIKEEIKEKIVE